MYTNSWSISHLVNRVAPEMDIEADDVSIYALAFLTGAKTARHIKRDEWLSLFKLPQFKKVTTIQGLKDPLLAETKAILSDKKSAVVMYKALFDWVKETEARRILTAEEALDMWQLIIPHVRPNWFLQKDFEEFMGTLVADEKSKKSVSKDTWDMLIAFIDESNNNRNGFVSSYEMAGAMPVLMDEFIMYLRRPAKSA